MNGCSKKRREDPDVYIQITKGRQQVWKQKAKILVLILSLIVSVWKDILITQIPSILIICGVHICKSAHLLKFICDSPIYIECAFSVILNRHRAEKTRLILGTHSQLRSNKAMLCLLASALLLQRNVLSLSGL